MASNASGAVAAVGAEQLLRESSGSSGLGYRIAELRSTDPIVFIPLLVLALLWPLVQLRSASKHLKRASSDRGDDLTTPAQAAAGAQEKATGFLLPSLVHHARFLPARSRHQFRYDTLYLALELNALEAGKQDIGGRLFRWNGRLTSSGRFAQSSAATLAPAKRCVTGIHPDDYLRLAFPQLEAEASVSSEAASRKELVSSSILLKLAYELREHDAISVGPQDLDRPIDSFVQEVGEVWAVTMPAFLGFHGINPLTIYYVYEKAAASPRGPLKTIVLEVHNTFAERHVYVLPTARASSSSAGASHREDAPEKRRAGYDHQWTFPRAFHVSPFNDRGGYYQLCIRDLFGPHSVAGKPELDVRLILLVHPDQDGQAEEKPDAPVAESKLRKKLLATLACHSLGAASASGRPGPQAMTPANMVKALVKQPFTLFLTFPRILWEAGKLHFRKRLDAFARPDMQEGAGGHAQGAAEWDGTGWPPSLNPTEASAAQLEKDGGILWTAPSHTERLFERRLCAFARRRVQLDPSLRIRVEFADRSQPPIDIAGEHCGASGERGGAAPALVIFTRSYSFFTDMLLHPDAGTAHLLGAVTARRWGVSDVAALVRFFQPLQGSGALSAAAGTSKSVTKSQAVRIDYARWALQCARSEQEPQLDASISRDFEALIDKMRGTPHWADSALDSVGDGTVEVEASPSDSSLSWALWQGLLAGKAEKWVFEKLGARYVKDTEPWLELRRALLRKQDGAVETQQQQRERTTKASYDRRLGSAVR